jgi:hypothetical protein
MLRVITRSVFCVHFMLRVITRSVFCVHFMLSVRTLAARDVYHRASRAASAASPRRQYPSSLVGRSPNQSRNYQRFLDCFLLRSSQLTMMGLGF